MPAINTCHWHTVCCWTNGIWQPWLWVVVSRLLGYEEMTFISSHFVQSMTGLHHTCQPLDLWIETTMNLNSKLKQGWMQILHNEQLFAATKNANNMARMKVVGQQNLKCQHLHMKHVECQPERLKKGGQAVHDLQASMHDFDADPFGIFFPTLGSLQYGLVALPRLVHDSKTAISWPRSSQNLASKECVHQD